MRFRRLVNNLQRSGMVGYGMSKEQTEDGFKRAVEISVR